MCTVCTCIWTCKRCCRCPRLLFRHPLSETEVGNTEEIVKQTEVCEVEHVVVMTNIQKETENGSQLKYVIEMIGEKQEQKMHRCI